MYTLKGFFMNKPTKLRFLLSLGNTKIVLTEENEQIQLYANEVSSRKNTVQTKRVLDAVSSR